MNACATSAYNEEYLTVTGMADAMVEWLNQAKKFLPSKVYSGLLPATQSNSFLPHSGEVSIGKVIQVLLKLANWKQKLFQHIIISLAQLL